jgi:hypothetical protein
VFPGTRLALRLIAVLAGIHAAGFLWAMLSTGTDGPLILLLGVFAAVSAAAASIGVWRLEVWAMRALLAWAFAAPLFAVTLFASLHPEWVGTGPWIRVLEASGLWLLFMGVAGWQVKQALRGRSPQAS